MWQTDEAAFLSFSQTENSPYLKHAKGCVLGVISGTGENNVLASKNSSWSKSCTSLNAYQMSEHSRVVYNIMRKDFTTLGSYCGRNFFIFRCGKSWTLEFTLQSSLPGMSRSWARFDFLPDDPFIYLCIYLFSGSVCISTPTALTKWPHLNKWDSFIFCALPVRLGSSCLKWKQDEHSVTRELVEAICTINNE